MLSPIHLALVTGIMLSADRQPGIGEAIIWTWGFLVGYFIEVVGVASGKIFGEYVYLHNLGPKVLDVPLIIGVQWLALAYCVKSVGVWLRLRFWPMLVLGMFLMVGFDSLMELVSEPLGYWVFSGGIAPVQNYVAWAIVSFAVIYPYKSRYNGIEAPNYVALVNFAWYIIFFLRYVINE